MAVHGDVGGGGSGHGDGGGGTSWCDHVWVGACVRACGGVVGVSVVWCGERGVMGVSVGVGLGVR